MRTARSSSHLGGLHTPPGPDTPGPGTLQTRHPPGPSTLPDQAPSRPGTPLDQAPPPDQATPRDQAPPREKNDWQTGVKT